MSQDISRTVASHIADARFETIPTVAIEAAKRSLLDAVGVMMAATSLGESVSAFSQIAAIHGGGGECTVIGARESVPPAMAAFANGALAHALDYEDSHDGAPIHPNAAVMPAALAIAELTGASGRELLAALSIGCDLVCRLGLSLRSDPADRGWYPPPILGAFGAAAACASLLRLDAQGVLDTLSLVLCQATCSAEIKYSPRSHIRAVRDAFPAQAGVLSALLAQRGVKGFELPLEGRAGFFSLYAEGQYDGDIFLRGLGRDYEGINVSFKPWPSCRGTHAAIEAALALRNQHALSAANIAAVELTIGPAQLMLCEPQPQKKAPVTAIDAKFSLPFTVAGALTHGQVTLESFTGEALKDPAVLSLAQRIKFAVDGRKGMVAGEIAILDTSGRRYAKRVDTPLGHPQKPMSQSALVEKFKDCAARATFLPSPARLSQIAAMLEVLDAPESSSRSFVNLLKPG